MTILFHLQQYIEEKSPCSYPSQTVACCARCRTIRPCRSKTSPRRAACHRRRSGAFVEVEEDIDGLIHISDMSWSKRVKHPSEVLKKGDVVDAMVLSIDADNQRLSLGLKQLATDIWDDFFSRHQVGSVVEGKVTRMTNFGAFVELDEGIEGLIHVSEFDDSPGSPAAGAEKIDLQVGNSYQMKIIKLSPQERKIGLSIRAMKDDQFRGDWETYQETEGTGTATLGDHFRNR
jgi:small subunit ribosomal protein S1